MTAVSDRRTRTGAALGLLAFAQLIISVDYNIVYVALPDIGAGLGFSSHTLQWTVSAYAVAFGGFLLLGGRASDLLGRRRMFLLGLALYGIGSLAGGLAGGPGLLIAARVVQGVGGAFLFPATLSLLVTTFAEGAARNRALSVWAAAGAGGLVLGALLGGVLTQAFGWRAVFLVNVPLTAVAAVAATALLPAARPAAADRRYDLVGALLATVGATLVVLTLVQGPASGWTSAPVLAGAVVGVLALALFVLVEARGNAPLMPLRLFGNRNLSVGVTVTFLFMATFGTLLYFVTVYLQQVLGYSALRAGLAFVPPAAAGFAGSMLGGRVATRFGVRATLIGALILGAVGVALTGIAVAADGSYGALLPGLLITNVFQGIVFTTMFAAATTGTPGADQGIASGIVSTGQQVGSAVGLAVLVAIAATRPDPVDGIRTAIFAIVAGILATALVALSFRRPG